MAWILLTGPGGLHRRRRLPRLDSARARRLPHLPETQTPLSVSSPGSLIGCVRTPRAPQRHRRHGYAPQQPIRMIGSTRKNGTQCVAITADEFMESTSPCSLRAQRRRTLPRLYLPNRHTSLHRIACSTVIAETACPYEAPGAPACRSGSQGRGHASPLQPQDKIPPRLLPYVLTTTVGNPTWAGGPRMGICAPRGAPQTRDLPPKRRLLPATG